MNKQANMQKLRAHNNNNSWTFHEMTKNKQISMGINPINQNLCKANTDRSTPWRLISYVCLCACVGRYSRGESHRPFYKISLNTILSIRFYSRFIHFRCCHICIVNSICAHFQIGILLFYFNFFLFYFFSLLSNSKLLVTSVFI